MPEITSGTKYETYAPNVSDAAIEELVAAVRPRVTAILGRYRTRFRPDVLEDIRSAVMLRIVRRLRRDEDDPIASFDGFVAAVTFNCVNDVLRDQTPARTQLKDRVRLLLTRSSRLASWHVRGEFTAGFAEWHGMPPREIRTGAVLPRDNLELAIVALLEANGAPLPLDAIVDAIAAAWGVAEAETVPIDDIEQEIASATIDIEARDELRLLWQEIGDLRLPQRRALLLNLRDGTSASAIEIFVLLGIASFDDIAAVLEMEAETLAALWNSLPLDDLTIAGQLGVQRQQVINLRRAARERLARRLHNTKR